MSIFSRFADIINSNINALLDKAEDPEKLIRMIIQEMEDTLVEVRTESAKSLADRKDLSRKAQWIDAEIQEWQRKAELAVEKDREDLAKAALNQKHKLQAEQAEFQAQLEKLDVSINNLAREIHQLQEKLQDARARQQTLNLRFTTENSRLKIKQRLYDTGSMNVVEKFERFERKLDDLEAQTESYDLGKTNDLKAEFDELENSDKVTDELDELKKKLNTKQ